MLLTDAAAGDERLGRAAQLGLPVVTAEPLPEFFSGPALSLGAWNTGLTAAIAIDLIDGFDRVVTVDVSATTPPARVKKRASAHFPAPIGPLWHELIEPPVANPRGVQFHSAPYDGELVGITARAEGDIEGRRSTVTRGVVDDPAFLSAIALAGAGKMALDGGGWNGQSEVSDHAREYLNACRQLGLGMATFKVAS